jgi:hypothetical protein
MRYSCGCELRLDALQAKIESMNNVSEHSSTYDDEIARRLKDIKKNAVPIARAHPVYSVFS